MSIYRLTAACAVAVLAAGVVPPTSATAAPPSPAATAPPSAPAAARPGPTLDGTDRPLAPGERAITLVTGDRVLVQTAQQPLRVTGVIPGAGRTDVQIVQSTVRGRLQVLPTDATALIASGRVDRRLFDVTELIESRYDDASRPDLPLIVQYDNAAQRRSRASALPGARPGADLPVLRATAVKQAKVQTGALWTALTGSTAPGARAAGPGRAPRVLHQGVRTLWLDALRQLSTDVSVPAVGAPTAWAAGHTGAGVKVAVLDSGYDANHPDLRDVVVGSQNFSTAPTVADANGHGTHVAATIAGSGAASEGRYRGVAPGARLLIGKVCHDKCPDSAIVAGMQWAAAQGAKIVNVSLGGRDGEGLDPVEQAVEDLTRDNGILFVIAAGNAGPAEGSVTSPGVSPSALTVGGVTKGEEMYKLSGAGPTVHSQEMKPEMAAPGVDIVAARAEGTKPNDAIGTHYTAKTGTSMATPHVAGAAAIVAAQHPGWTPEQIKNALVGTARPIAAATVFEQGTGRLDVAATVTRQVHASPAVVNFGIVLSGDETAQSVATKVVSYRNDGAAPVTLDLAMTPTDRAGRPIAAGTFAVQPAQLTVPAGGTATASVTVDVSTGPKGPIGGVLVASAGGDVTVRTLVGATNRPKEYTQTFAITDRTGSTTAAGPRSWVTISNRATGQSWTGEAVAGKVELTVEPGEYALAASILTPAAGSVPSSRTVLIRPRLTLGRPATHVLDAAQGRPMTFDVGRPDAAPVDTYATFRLDTSEGSSVSFTTETNHTYLVPVAPEPGLSALVRTTLARPRPGGWSGFRDSPYAYHIVKAFEGRLPGPVERIDPAEFATVNAAYAAAMPGESGAVETQATVDGSRFGPAHFNQVEHTLPARRTEYFTGGPARWQQALETWQHSRLGATTYQRAVETSYVAGRTYSTDWNRGVFGPAVGDPGQSPALRFNDGVVLFLEPFSDQTPGHEGSDLKATETSRLFIDGELRATGKSSLDAPQIAGQYRIEYDATRPLDGPARPTSKVQLAWTLALAATTGPTERLPLMAVRYAPALGDDNTAPGGREFLLPVRVERPTDGVPGEVRAVTVEVSYNDGATWTPTTLRPDGTNWVTTLRHPPATPAGTYVSLRARATDSGGASVEQTLLRTYRLR